MLSNGAASADRSIGRECIMFTIYRDCGRIPLGQSDSILGVLRFAESTGVGRYDVDEAGIRPRYWGSVVRNQDGSFILLPERSADWLSSLESVERRP
jgi:hypothetical protein